MRRRGSRLRRRYGRAAHAPFTVSKTYDVVTPESAEDGDIADSGFDFEPTPMTLRDTIYEVKRLGFIDHAEGPHGGHLSLYEGEGDTDYRTGAVTTHAIHIRSSEKAMRRLKEVLKSKGVKFYR